MTSRGRSTLAFVAMLVWFAVLLLLSGAVMLIGMAFGSEAYRGGSIPIEELALIYGPFLSISALMAAMIVFWNKGKQGAAVAAWAASVVLLLAGSSFLGAIF